ncbi:LCM-domain-containing protein [Aulographum hederae CBS 113979]|uniref:tRNA wybutosine-synthesizing protein 4 n=1 Tax=Aulographum hederae CBS 113979 TaxID=1176131 RepID=A0A6G1HCD0_9PEZI|nr:LCM-domain-containing protein [Aulographum hederae CBS 113979]
MGSRTTPKPLSRRQKADESIIGTNSYSIVSKRSVEKLYYPSEPAFLKSFVSKFKRRAPLINRGYWLRMRAIEHVVSNFIQVAEPADEKRRKVVVNLGCGYDILPFRTLWQQEQLGSQSASDDVIFVDVDYPQLMKRKVEIVRNNDILYSRLSNPVYWPSNEPESTPEPVGGHAVMLRSKNYIAIGCDLRELSTLKKLLQREMDIDDASFLFTAEVSIAYMSVEAADKVIHWASTFKASTFCLLEQFLPDGPDHPFARTMLDHFGKQTPLKCLYAYPQLEDQRLRSLTNGFTSAEVLDLWSFWLDQATIPRSEKLQLNDVEPFDEWEELALFGGHYFVLVATNHSTSTKYLPDIQSVTIEESQISFDVVHEQGALRRFGAILVDGIPNNNSGAQPVVPNMVKYHGGVTPENKHTGFDMYSRDPKIQIGIPFPEEIMCHTITRFGENRVLLAGGRTSPTKASSRCWVLRHGEWMPTADLIPARYRHCAVPVQIGAQQGVLVFGGKTGSGEVLSHWQLWTEKHGWSNLERTLRMNRPEARFGAAMMADGHSYNETSGYLMGGMDAIGHIHEDIWMWELSIEQGRLQLSCREHTHIGGPWTLSYLGARHARFGATLLDSSIGLLLIGGVVSGPLLRQHEEICLFRAPLTFCGISLSFKPGHRPLLVGFGSAAVDGNVFLIGGGAVCFSFGAFWNTSFSMISATETPQKSAPFWRLRRSKSLDIPAPDTRHPQDFDIPLPIERESGESRSDFQLETAAVSRLTVTSEDEFRVMVETREPEIIEEVTLGPCTELWTSSYLTEKLGHERPISIHSCSSLYMNFQTRNYTFKTEPFGDFMTRASKGEHVYLRALSVDKPYTTPANLTDDLPTIAEDFVLPSSFQQASDNQHSSVLRISGAVTMWLHYDVMSNVLCQIRGSKKIILFPPSDVKRLQYLPGQTTSELNVFLDHQTLGGTHPVEAILEPGQVLFIPSCWSHVTAPEGEEMSVAVNVFFKDLQTGYAAGKDVYGNRDLSLYQDGRRDIERIIKAHSDEPPEEAKERIERIATVLEGTAALAADDKAQKEVTRILRSGADVPTDIRQFYLDRLAADLRGGLID